MAAPKTTSDTAIAGEYTYIFLNRPDSDDLDWIRFTDPANPTKGIIQGRRSVEGPIAAQVFSDNSIKLYYTAVAEESPGKACLKELRLLNADQEKTDVTNGWQTSDQDSNINFEEQIVENSRLVDGTSFLSVSTRKDGGTLYPVVTWKNAGKKPFVFYAKKIANGKWETTRLDLPK